MHHAVSRESGKGSAFMDLCGDTYAIAPAPLDYRKELVSPRRQGRQTLVKSFAKAYKLFPGHKREAKAQPQPKSFPSRD